MCVCVCMCACVWRARTCISNQTYSNVNFSGYQVIIIINSIEPF